MDGKDTAFKRECEDPSTFGSMQDLEYFLLDLVLNRGIQMFLFVFESKIISRVLSKYLE